MFSNVVVDENVNKFIKILKIEHESLKKGFPPHYKPLLARISPDDIHGVLEWIIKYPNVLKDLSPTHPIRIGAKKPGQPSSYPFPITLHFTMDTQGNVQLIYDPNSKLPRVGEEIRKESEVKKEEKPSKQRGKGSQKTVRDTWTFHAATRHLQPSVANVVTGEGNVKDFNLGKAIYQSNARNPFLMSMQYGTEYASHGQDEKVIKSISFAPRAPGDLFDLLTKIDEYKPDLVDILWICYATTRAVATFHANGYLHRDIKLENFLFLRNKHGFTVYLNDWDDALSLSDAADCKTEFGSPKYKAFDRPCFRDIINEHNMIIDEMEYFGTQKAKELHDIGAMSDEFSGMYETYVNVCPDQNNPAVIDKEGFDLYMRWRTHETVEAVKLDSERKQCDFAINIILSKPEHIPTTTPNHIKDDAWALFLTLYQLLLYSKIQHPPQILKDIESLMLTNLVRVRSERLDAEDMCVKLEILLKQFIDEPTLMPGLTQIEQDRYKQRLLKQLEFHQIQLGDCLRPVVVHAVQSSEKCTQ